MFCRECGRDLGRGWTKAPLCADCAPNHLNECSCSFPDWDDECVVHHDRNPYEIPF